MKSAIKLEVGSEVFERQLELSPEAAIRAGAGQLELVLDEQTAKVDWAEIVPGVYSILVGGRSYEACVRAQAGGTFAGLYTVSVGLRHYRLELRDPRQRRYRGSVFTHEGPQEILAPMPGKIARILVSENQEVARGDGLLVIEAMKMQNELRSPRAGRVEKIYVVEGTGVETASRLLRLG